MRHLVTLVLCLAFIACTVAEIPGDASEGGAALDPKAGTVNSRAKDGVCEPGSEPVKAEKIDPEKLTPCECKNGGKARCAPKDRLPETLVNQLDDCDGGAGSCVPDTVIASGGAPLGECKSAGKSGRCLSLCVPRVAENLKYLTRGDGDSCPEDERCIPCVDPLTGEATGICNIDSIEEGSTVCRASGTAAAGSGIDIKPGEKVTCPFSGTPGDPNRFPTCGTGGRCLENALVPADIAKRLSSCPAAEGKPGLCIPEIYVVEKGKHLPGKCSSFAGIEGRCFSMVFKDVQEQSDVLAQDACKADERCLPCFNPATGKPTGACESVECDKASTEAIALKECCNRQGAMRGKCVPSTDVPSEYQKRLLRHQCDKGDLCAPSDQIDTDGKAVRCASDAEPGVCVSDCINIGLFEGIFISRGSCRADQKCIPCKGPLGRPTGAPGCPK
ncbi:MAG: hypothetical protein KIT84_26610 [Labilithrix sp.]|nr:hypothetical protein [Labilithrix sp.]MCW5814626.1 hypothetical protein [Labilithrix sp.]